MKFKYNRTEDNTVEIRLADGRFLEIIEHVCGELDFEGPWSSLTPEEEGKLMDWYYAKYNVDTRVYEDEI
jgi:hypothetical protein